LDFSGAKTNFAALDTRDTFVIDLKNPFGFGGDDLFGSPFEFKAS
jgi:hypothetical protein